MDRYQYFSPNSIGGTELKAGYDFAKAMAQEHGEILTICVNNIQNCDQFLEKIFNPLTVNKLRSYQPISDGNVSVQLKSPKGLKGYTSFGVLLALHPSPEAISKLEGQIKAHSLTVIAEVPVDGSCAHLELWASEQSVNRLTIEENA